MTYVFWLAECDLRHGSLVGGKATGLAALLRQDFRVPPGFVIGTDAYQDFVSESGLDGTIRELLVRADSLQAQAEAGARIMSLFVEREPQPLLRHEFLQAYRTLGEPPVAVRSSAISEDGAEASFAGVHETQLWVEGTGALVRAVVDCWASLFTPQALAYYRRVGVRPEETAMGVVVQAMVPAEAAGVMLTIDPLTGDRSQITIEASFGIGEAVVAGEVTPDRYAVDKVTLDLRSRVLSAKHVAYRFDRETGGLRLVDVPAGQQCLPCLSDEEVLEVARLGTRVEQALGGAQDIEWAIGPERAIYLLQARPETTWSRRPGARALRLHRSRSIDLHRQ
jgi:pyruvate,water dikinase